MKNAYEIRGDTVAIFLRRRGSAVLECIIDAADLQTVSCFRGRWYAWFCKHGRRFYAAMTLMDKSKKCGCRQLYMHRLLMGESCPLLVDHINRDSLDNRRDNLRLVGYSESNRNTTKSARKSAYATRLKNGKWQSQIYVGGKNHYCGQHPDAESANLAAKNRLKELLPLEALCN